MILFAIDGFSNKLSGRSYKSVKDAIKDGGYSVWCNEKIKLAFSFGNGTEKDFKRYCKDNKCKIISENEFYKELYSLPFYEQRIHVQFIREQLNLIMIYEKEIRKRTITGGNYQGKQCNE